VCWWISVKFRSAEENRQPVQIVEEEGVVLSLRPARPLKSVDLNVVQIREIPQYAPTFPGLTRRDRVGIGGGQGILVDRLNIVHDARDVADRFSVAGILAALPGFTYAQESSPDIMVLTVHQSLNRLRSRSGRVEVLQNVVVKDVLENVRRIPTEPGVRVQVFVGVGERAGTDVFVEISHFSALSILGGVTRATASTLAL